MQEALIRIAELAPTLSHTEVRVLLEMARQAQTAATTELQISGRKLAEAANLSYSNTREARASLNRRQIISSDKGSATKGSVHRLLFMQPAPNPVLERAPNFGAPLRLTSRALAHAPAEDEEISEEEEQSVARSKEWFKNNQGTSLEDMAAELGFSMDHIRNGKAPA